MELVQGSIALAGNAATILPIAALLVALCDRLMRSRSD